MNPQISRRSFRASAHYSGVLHQQGRMIVDADLNEQSDITDARLVDLLRATVGSGAPAADGLGLQVDAGRPVLVPGRLVVDGLSARLDGLPGDRIGLDQQPDYPGAPVPTATAFRVYADVWERSVTALEDSALMDPGLHGADTAARSQTVLQVKTCPFTLDPLSPVANPPQGNAPLTLTLKTSTTAGSAGDPCAAAGSVSERIGNYLFRIEVHDLVTRGGQEHLVIKWSRDNGAEACRVGEEPPGFTQGAWSWEFFDADSEKQAGLHPFATQVRRGVLVDAPYQAPSGSQPKAFARQWDGWADINLADSTVSGSERGVALAGGANGQVSFDTRSGRALVLDLEMMTLRLELQAGGASARHAFVPGDHWLACVREAERETLETPAGSQLLDRALPAGITHHHMELGRWDGSRWTRMTINGVGGGFLWNGFWGSGRNDVWLVARDTANEEAVFFHWDGTSFRRQTLPDDVAATSCDGLWGSSPTDVWAACSFGRVLHYDGMAWRIDQREELTSPSLFAIAGSGADLWAVGTLGGILHRSR